MMSGPYETDPDGLLYEPSIRDSLRTALPDDRLLGYEALLALRRAAFVLDHHTRALRSVTGQDDPGMRVLIRLHGEPDGVPVEALVADRGQDVLVVLDEMDREGMLERSESTVRLSELGTERIDEVLRKLADRVATLLNGVPAEQLALLRHVSLRLILNHQMR